VILENGKKPLQPIIATEPAEFTGKSLEKFQGLLCVLKP
jgi:hypothetical protein